MRWQRGRRAGRLALGGATAAMAVATVGAVAPTGAGAAAGAPGVSAKEIQVGAISTLTGPIAANFESLVPGVEAYFDYVNAHGGVNGRKLVMAHSLDDGGNPSQFNSLANTLINQDHVFAVVGVATAFFSPNVFLENKTPVFGYAVTSNWSPGQNLFAAGGSVQYYPAGEPSINWWVNKVNGKKANVGLLALGVASSADSCKAFTQGLQQAGIKVGYTDFNVAYGGNPAPDIKRMQAAGVNTVVSCMDVNTNISMARAIQQYNYKGVKSLWLSGNDQPTLDQYQSLMQNVWFQIAHVPFAYGKTDPGKYPALAAYLKTMRKYQPKYVLDEVALQGWESAALFAQGVKMAGKNLTQANLVTQVNKITNFTAGLFAPVNWTQAHNVNDVTPPYCAAWIQVKGDQFVPAYDTNNSSFICFGSNIAHPKMVSPPSGTPGT